MMAKTPVSAVLIVRDEERCLARCLRSLTPWVDEIVVLDTGSIDRTRQVAREYGARVHDFTWRADFAAARNAALALARTPWNVVVDADEWILSGGEVLARLGEHSGEVGLVRQRSTSRSDGVQVRTDTLLERCRLP